MKYSVAIWFLPLTIVFSNLAFANPTVHASLLELASIPENLQGTTLQLIVDYSNGRILLAAPDLFRHYYAVRGNLQITLTRPNTSTHWTLPTTSLTGEAARNFNSAVVFSTTHEIQKYVGVHGRSFMTVYRARIGNLERVHVAYHRETGEILKVSRAPISTHDKNR